MSTQNNIFQAMVEESVQVMNVLGNCKFSPPFYN